MGGADDKESNEAPTAVLAITKGATGSYILDGSGSTDPDGDSLTYYWNWVVGNATTEEARIEVEFPPEAASAGGQFLSTLMVEDPDGATGLSSLVPLVLGDGTNEAPKIALGETNRWIAANADVVLDASPSNDSDGDRLSYEWIWGPRDATTEDAHGLENACDESSADPLIFSTGCIGQDQSFDVTFGKAGTFYYHCHPHPWMKAKLVVDPSGTNTAPVTIEIENFRYPSEIRLGLGTKVTFVNKDPVKHTATLEDFTPGSGSAPNEPVFRQTLSEGEYIVRLVLRDPGGGRASQTWGVKAGGDAPPSPDVRTCPSTGPLTAAARDTHCYYNVTHEYRIESTLTWTDTGNTNVPAGNISIGKLDEDGGWEGADQCVGQRGTGFEQNTAYFDCRLAKGDYQFRVEATAGVLSDWELVTTGNPRAIPGFGDSAGGGHHH